ncbi:MAG TPA: hypothetical protein PKI81_04940, partial [bacterium]|nr:hypothetical protein [bacterium]
MTMVQIDSILPLFLILWPLLGALLVFLAGRGGLRWGREGTAILVMIVQLALSICQSSASLGGKLLLF